MNSTTREVEGRSPSFIRHRANKSYEMQNEYLLNCEELLENQRFVFLYDIHGKQVEKILLQSMVVGDILHDKPISPDDVVVFIQDITIPETRVDELNLTFMSDSLHKFIRWPRSQIKQFQLPTTPNLHIPHIHCTPSLLMSQRSNTSTHDCSSFEHTIEGLPESHARCPYVHRIRANKKSKGPRILGVSRANTVTLIDIHEAKIKRPCKKQCLQNINELDVLSLRYQTLGMTKYKDRATRY